MQETVFLVLKAKALFYLVIITFNLSQAQQIPVASVHKLYSEGIYEMINGDYDKSLMLFQKLNNEHKGIPLGKIMLAAHEIFYSYDFKVPYNEKKIMKYLDEAEDQSRKLLKTDKNNKWYRYYLSLSEGYKTLYEGLNSDWLNMVYDGISCISNYNSILEIDTNFYEAFIAIGAFKFWRSENVKYLQWLPFINDEREEGIRRLDISKNKNSYHDFIAMDILFWIRMRRNEFEEARGIAEESLHKYPNNRLFKMNLARYYETTDRIKAIRLYEEVLGNYELKKPLNRVNEIIIKSKIAASYFALGEMKKVLEITQPIVNIKYFTAHEASLLSERLDRIRQLNSEAKSSLRTLIESK